ncbi:transcriptional activator DEMETER isoform X2 [Rhodamnia argentea]|uniref:Transcriptional activator DEMETER isoform X2 n=1 Tax=Rhodamnia argentea TaxID=178133 RepID=A0ABM3HZG6_9MYRT|nr:transcriptional activator DEMETER isoform X2 [Rhodamnia argentea]
MEGAGDEEVRAPTSWIPATPAKPILPRPGPICMETRETEANGEDSSESDEFPPGFAPVRRTDGVAPSSSSGRDGGPKMMGGLDDLAAAGFYGQDEAARMWQNLSVSAGVAVESGHFQGLLALVDAAAMGGPPDEHPKSSFISFSDPHGDSPWPSPSPVADFRVAEPDPPHRPWVDGNHWASYPDGFANAQIRAYDLNLPPSTSEDAMSKGFLHFAPITPEKALGVEKKIASQTHNICTYERGRGVEHNMEEVDRDATKRLGPEVGRQDKELQEPVMGSPSSAVSALMENHDPEKGDPQIMSLNKTPQQKTRRKKHRPKVVKEGKPKRTPRSTASKPADGGKTTVKRKYVRRKGVDKPPALPREGAEDSSLDLEVRQLPKKSCRKALNFDIEEQPMEKTLHTSASALESPAQDLQQNRSVQPNLSPTEKNYISTPEQGMGEMSFVQNNHNPEHSDAGYTRKILNKKGQLSANNGCDTIALVTPRANPEEWGKGQEAPYCGESTALFMGEYEAQCKRKLDTCELAKFGSTNFLGAQYNSLQAYMTTSWIHFPVIHKRKRTEKVQQNTGTSHTSAAKVTDWSSPPQPNSFYPATTRELGAELDNRHQTVGCLLEINKKNKATKKRSRAPTRVRDFASLIRLLPDDSHKQAEYGYSQKPHSCIEALLEEIQSTLSRKKRTKKRLSLVTSAYGGALQLHGPLIMHNNQSTSNRSSGAQTELLWRQMTSLDVIIKQLEHLDINRETNGIQNALASYEMTNHEHNAIVLYKRDGTIVPFDNSFGPVKKRRPRPKVDLDEETSRVWKLLLENINSEGIDGTDEEKARWWEEERRVFQGRADSFIARMHLVQGDRRFSPWKGSVVDSVVGVFLTQNVSDHLSSSAFMSLASRFPQRRIPEMCSHEGTAIIINEPDTHILEMEYPLSEKSLNETVWGQSSITNNEYEKNETKEVVNSDNFVGSKVCSISLADEPKCQMSISSGKVSEKLSPLIVDISTAAITEIDEGHIKGDGKAESSSPNSVISSQSSVDSPPAQAAERTGSSSDVLMNTFSKTDSLDGLQSFMQLLGMAGSNVPLEVSLHEIEDASVNEHTENVINKSSEMEDGEETLQTDTSCPRSTSGFTCCLGVPEVECPEKFIRKTNFSESSKNENEQIIKDETATSFTTTDSKKTEICEETVENSPPCNSCLGGENSEYRPAVDREIVPEAACHGETSKIQTDVCFSELVGGKESTGTGDISKGAGQESADTHPSKHGLSLTDESNKMNKTNSKGKSRGAGKEKKEDFDWDSLRRRAESNGRKRVRTPNTMDSVDWEAVRCADVNEIADAIKERGMNNVLAGRIKDFLNRLMREHGSVDLEWLRDVPPDKAKEYLLSMRGLGLKSVECVRLLTLHHLAFPVDTNVGRIAVRLGWVPLQPLPESLQLHLLELYPVLESIQQYLWPRLCKLDQRTLYELHYQMITFGKVFCTKSKPNCNACPMRGECRHFASAFASARLALPGPEEKSIVTAMGRNIASQNIGETLPLTLPLAKENLQEQQQEARPGASTCLPIIEEPATPEPDCTQIGEIDMEDMFSDDFNEIPTIKLNMKEFTQNLQKYMQHNMDLQEDDMSKALVALTPEAASIPVPKLKNVSRLRTEHLVYEIPEGHPLMNGLDKLEADDPSKYLLAIWTPGETASSVQPPEHRCNSQEGGTLCNEITCVSCNGIRESNSQTVRGTFLIPCRTAMRGSFPLNGTYFQVNEVFADHETSINPIDVPRSLLWKLQRRTVYFGTSIPTIFKGLPTEGIQQCFWRGFVCVRGFDRKTRAPRPLMARLHFPASKLSKTRGKKDDGQ